MARICRVKKEKSYLREICSRNAKIAAKRQRNLRSRRISRAIRLYNQGHTLVEIARILKVSVATVYKYKKFLEDKKQTK
jgi:DNA invertase Pin-like site-specific DNA recombinase